MANHLGQLDTRIEIITPENIAFQHRVAGPFRRLMAYAVDLVVRLVFILVVACVLIIALNSMGMGALGVGPVLVLYFVVDWFYGGLFETFMNGQTLGKRLLQIRVISANGQPISGWQAILRNFARVADALPMVYIPGVSTEELPIVLPIYQVGLVAMLFTRRFQRLGDLLCGTMVVVEEPQRLYGVARIDEPAVVRLSGELPADFRASHSLGRALSAYVQRRLALGVARRDEIARHLAVPLRSRFEVPAEASDDQLLCALYYRAFIADRPEELQGSSPFAASAAVVESPFAGTARGASMSPLRN